MTRASDTRAQIKGRSQVLIDALDLLERVAGFHQLPILIYGETGTGKELAARLVHEKSKREGQFVAFNPDVTISSCGIAVWH